MGRRKLPIIPKRDIVKYFLCKEVDLSIEELTDTEIMKLNKSQLQIALKEMRLLHLRESATAEELSTLISSDEALIKLLEKHGYIVSRA